MRKFFNGYSKSERLATIVLMILISAGQLLYWHLRSVKDVIAENIMTDTLFMKQADSLYAELKSNAGKSDAGKPYKTIAPPPSPFIFDPNRADSVTLVRLGLPPFVARNVVRYRVRGGVYRDAAKLATIYGMSKEDYERIAPFVRIVKPDTVRASGKNIAINNLSEEPSNPRQIQSIKFDSIIRIEINDADTAMLMKIPGVGRGYSAMIISYREKLGGFYSVEQLNEVDGLPDSVVMKLKSWLNVDTTLIRKININRMSLTQLRKHPYVNFYQARQIVELKRMNGSLRDFSDLHLLEEFNNDDIARQSYYFRFE